MLFSLSYPFSTKKSTIKNIILLQENRREYEKRVAAIVEQSWMMTFPDESDTNLGKSKQNNDNNGATTSGAAGSRSGNLNNDAANPGNHNSDS